MASKTNAKVGKYKYYRLQKTVGFKMVDGKKVRIIKSFYGISKTDAQRKYEYWLEHKDDEIPTVDTSRKLGQLAKDFNEILLVDASYAISTRELYVASCKQHLLSSEIASKPISEVDGDLLQEHYIELNITASALRTYNNYMRILFKWLQRKGYCANIMRMVVIPEKKVVKKSDEIIVWTDNELDLLEERLADYDRFVIILFALYAGLRISEILGLKWSDIYDGQIHVVRQNYRLRIKDPKYGSARTVPLHPKIEKALAEYPRTNEYIFVSKSGQLLDYHNVIMGIERAYKRAGIQQKKFHAFRATFCTKLCLAGVPLQVASELMGHKNINVTAKFYTLIEDAEKRKAIAKL